MYRYRAKEPVMKTFPSLGSIFVVENEKRNLVTAAYLAAA